MRGHRCAPGARHLQGHQLLLLDVRTRVARSRMATHRAIRRRRSRRPRGVVVPASGLMKPDTVAVGDFCVFQFASKVFTLESERTGIVIYFDSREAAERL